MLDSTRLYERFLDIFLFEMFFPFFQLRCKKINSEH